MEKDPAQIPHQDNKFKKKLRLTHFLSLPLIHPAFKLAIKDLQDKIYAILDESERSKLVLNSPDVMHITLSVLDLQDEEKKLKALEIFEKQQEEAKKFLESEKLKINMGGLDFFGYKDPKSLPKEEKMSKAKKKTTGVIFLDVLDDEHSNRLKKLASLWIKEYVNNGIILKDHLSDMRLNHDCHRDIYHAKKYHVTLFRFEEGTDLSKVIESFKELKFGHVYGETLELSVMGTYDETKFYKNIKKHYL